jgi:PAS domain S-box-containing protein
MKSISIYPSKEKIELAVRSAARLPGQSRRLRPYGLALLFVALAALLRWLLPEVLGPTPFLVFYLAWVAAAALGGLGPGLLATVASWLCIDLLFDPTNSLINFADPATTGRLVVLLAGGLGVSLVAEAMRRGRIRLRKSEAQLQRQAEQLQRQTEELQLQTEELTTANEELRDSEQALRQSEERLRATFNNAGVGLLEVGLDDRVIAANDRFCQILGYGRQELLGKTIHELTAPEDRAHSDALNAQLRRQQADRLDYEKRYLRHDGTPLWVHVMVSAIHDASGRWQHFIGTVEDISERRQAEEALRHSEERFHSLFEDDLTGDFVSTPEGRILLCNPAFAAMFRFLRAQDAVGTSIVDLYLDAREREALLERLRRERKIERFEVWRKRRDGEPIYIVESLVGHFDDQDRLYEIKGYLFDDTDRKHAEDALRELTATLETKVAQRTAELEHRARQLQKLTLELSQTEDRERRQLAEVLHDDLQQMLAAAKFHLDILSKRIKGDPPEQTIALQVTHMLSDAIAKSRSLSHELSPAVLYHDDFAETLRWLAGQVQDKHGLTVHVDAFGPTALQSDALKGFLYKGAQELLFNVVKHARVKEARIRIRRLGCYVCLSVSDRGRGFDPQEVRQTAGFGLFSIVERVELLGGRMEIKSAKGKGSTFRIVVPDNEKGAGEEKKSKIGRGEERTSLASDVPTLLPPALTPDRRLRVLLADDHKIVRECLMSLLSEAGDVEIVGQAANGREAVNQAYRLEPDVIVMDVAMPLINGDDATRQIKRHLPRTRVIALSMYEETDVKTAMHQAGAESYVLKTASSEELLAAIRGNGLPV